ncbi:hypothetical protein CN918_26375 [Priestia megaterium]|nr:hypothetical protein CN918_26375 [Priestia megaterium]
MRIAVTGGGTGGHIYPMATVAQYLQKHHGADILYIGNENEFFPDKRLANYFTLPFSGIPSRGMEGGRPINFLWKNMQGVLKARKILKEFQPDLVFSTGGFVSFPVVTAASQLHIPYVLHEQNTVMGKVNRLASKKASCILHTFPIYQTKQAVVTGNPVRFTDKLVEQGEHVLFLGGSGGSLALNEAGVQFSLLHPNIPVIIQTGKVLYDKTKAYAAAEGASGNLILVPYKDDLMDLYKEAKLIVTRSGSGSIFEIANLGIPSIFIPLPNSAEDHQKRNALFFTQENAALMVEQDANFQDALNDNIVVLWQSEERRNELRTNLEKLAVRNSEELIAKQLVEIYTERSKQQH